MLHGGPSSIPAATSHRLRDGLVQLQGFTRGGFDVGTITPKKLLKLVRFSNKVTSKTMVLWYGVVVCRGSFGASS